MLRQWLTEKCIAPASPSTPKEYLLSCQVHRGADEAGGERQRSPKKLVEQPESQGQADTEQERGHQWRVELEAWPFDAKIAWQAPEPAQLIGSEPAQQPNNNQESAKAHEYFAEMFHGQALWCSAAIIEVDCGKENLTTPVWMLRSRP